MGFEIGKTVAGYEIVEVLGSSKTGVAYKVRNVFAQRFEVLKILPKGIQDDEEQNARFLREIKVHAQLLHPNIVTFYNARDIEGQLVMTTEFVPGVTVAERLQSGPIVWREAGRYAGQALSALEYAHGHGIVHRGLSSANLIVTAEGIIRLTGFGLAKSVSDPQLTAAGAVIGALKYMAPEQVKGDEVDARCDLYSLGIVLYEMLTGKLPFEAKGQFEIMLAHVNSAPKHASDVNPDVPRELGDVVAKALAKAPDDRFQNAREFREAIEQMSLSREPHAAETIPSAVPLAPVVSSPDRLLPEKPSPTVAVPVEDESLNKPLPDVLASTAEEWKPPLAQPELPKPMAEAAAPVEPAPPPAVSPVALPDAWALESALELAESRLATMELKPALPVVEEAAATQAPAAAPSPIPRDPWAIESEPASPESGPAPAEFEPASAKLEEIAALSALPTTVSPASLVDGCTLESALTHTELKLAATELEPALPAVEVATLNEAPAAVPASLPDARAIESAIASAEPELTSTESPMPAAELEPPSPAIVVEPPAVQQIASPGWWGIESGLVSAESEHADLALPPADPEITTPVVAALAISDSPVVVSPKAQSDLWPLEFTKPAESKPDFTQLELLSAALEPPKPPVEVPSEADAPAFSSSLWLPGAWDSESAPASIESKHAPAEFASSPAGLEPVTTTEIAETPLVLWPATPPDPWASESPLAPSALEPEAAELQSLSAALEPSQPPVETMAPFEAPATELVSPSPELPPEQSVAAAAAAASAPRAVSPARAPVNPDLLTALFGDTLLSRLSLTLVVCAIVFFLGTVALFAVLSVTKP